MTYYEFVYIIYLIFIHTYIYTHLLYSISKNYSNRYNSKVLNIFKRFITLLLSLLFHSTFAPQNKLTIR